MDVILDGWLIKLSERRLFRRTKWSKYWFVLRHSNEHCEQFLLEYYKDSSCHDLRGRIDLNQCDRVEIKFKDECNNSYGFDVQISNKLYSLIAETDCDMNRWIRYICSVCGLKRQVEDDVSYNLPDPIITLPVCSLSSLPSSVQENELSCQKKNSSPYILISECFTGKPIPDISPNVDKTSLFSENSVNCFASVDINYDYPKPLISPEKQTVKFENNLDNWYQIPPAPRTLKTDNDSKLLSDIEIKSSPDESLGNVFFSDDEPGICFENQDIESVRREALELARQLESLGLDDSGIESEQSTSPTYAFEDSQLKDDEFCANHILSPPPRPPKPATLNRLKNITSPTFCTEQNSHNLSSNENKISTNVFNSMINCAENYVQNDLSPSTKVPLPLQIESMYDVPKPRSEDNITALIMSNCDKSKNSNDFHIYNNAPPRDCLRKNSILAYEYKPSLTFSEESENITDNLSDITSESLSSVDKGIYSIPPAVDRKLKPRKSIGEGSRSGLLSQESPNSVSSPSEKFFEVFDYGPNKDENLCREKNKASDSAVTAKPNEIQYLDLNLDSNIDKEETIGDKENQTIVYKKVDFLRTEAFNKMRQNVEETYRNSNQ
ncbi:GRB2-associated-binding protein 1-like isoform X1 [Centruroides vittatus]|uniref:GRB2-associated-binding protein 1-like isoform X1 n=2 Tax=Centruroides vittatus TaxID=120091 RepID=UPI00351087F2